MYVSECVIIGIAALTVITFLIVFAFGLYLVVDEMAREIRNRIKTWKNYY